jgi:adenosylhomocysteine nucleosidase
MELNQHFVVLISADAEWRVVRKIFTASVINRTPYGEWFSHQYGPLNGLIKPVIFMHGGWGKVAASGSTQYAIGKWHPQRIINLGTCGGFKGEISSGEIILVEKTVIYDIYEQMGDPDEHIHEYMTEIDNSWISLPYPTPVRRLLLVSGDRDLIISEIPMLKAKYGAIAGDWESGAIAWVSHKNQTPCLILRGVTDLVGGEGGEAYNGNVRYYYKNTELVMKMLIEALPRWLLKAIENDPSDQIKKVDSQ